MKTIKNGVWPVMITPFTADNKIDWDGVQKIIDWYDKEGVTGIFAVCQSSEMFHLSKQERFDLARFVIDNTPCLLYTSPSTRDKRGSRMPSSA